MALHILALKYMRTPPTHYFLESSGQVAYMDLTLTRAIYVTWQFHNSLVHVLAPSRSPN